jgi:hypothetical protein
MHQVKQGWRWLALGALLVAAGCGPAGGHGEEPGDSDAALVSESTSEEILTHLKLTGFAKHGAKQWVLLLVAAPGKPTEHLKLMKGQCQSGVEVRSLNAVAQTAVVRVGELDATLSLATEGVKPEDGYAWLQRLTPDEHARLYNSPARQQLVEDHSRAQEERQLQELARELEEREQLAPPASQPDPTKSNELEVP